MSDRENAVHLAGTKPVRLRTVVLLKNIVYMNPVDAQQLFLFVDLGRNRTRPMETHDVKEFYWFFFMFYILALCAYRKVGYPTWCVYTFTRRCVSLLYTRAVD